MSVQPEGLTNRREPSRPGTGVDKATNRYIVIAVLSYLRLNDATEADIC
jgi:hypothetical protein